MLSIILIQPKTQGNLGAICRVMKNFGLKDLILINPRCKIGLEARKRAKHANDILKNAKIKDESYLKNFHTLIATTSRLGTDYNIPRSPITPDQLIKIINTNKKIALIFGREDKGLTNEEIKQADFIVSIPTSKIYPSLNLSHSVAILLYELFKEKENITSHILPASKQEKDHLLKMINQSLNRLEFSTQSKKQTQITIWKRIIGKSFLTKRESFALMGFFKKIR